MSSLSISRLRIFLFERGLVCGVRGNGLLELAIIEDFVVIFEERRERKKLCLL